MNTKNVVATAIGAALYAFGSMIMIPIGPNTSLRIAIAILVIFSIMYGPTVGFLTGFIGHALNDLIMYGSVWWSWVFLSAIVGLIMGFIYLDKTFSIRDGLMTKNHIIKMYVLALVSVLLSGLVALIGDVVFYGEPVAKTLVQLALACSTNFIVIAVVGIPVVIAMTKRNQSYRGLDA